MSERASQLQMAPLWRITRSSLHLADATLLRSVTADTEVLLYAVLDLSAKPVWGLALLLAMPDEGHVLLPEWMAAPGGALSGGGYGSVPSGNDA